MEQITYILYIYSSLWTILLRNWAKLRCKSITWHVTHLAEIPNSVPTQGKLSKAMSWLVSPWAPQHQGCSDPSKCDWEAVGNVVHCIVMKSEDLKGMPTQWGGGCHLMSLRYQATGSAVAPPRSDAPPLEMPSPPPFPVFSHYLSFPYYFFFYPSFVNLWCGWGINRSLKSGHKYCLSFISGLFIVDTLKLVVVSRDDCTCGPLITVTGKREHGVGRKMSGGRTRWMDMTNSHCINLGKV